MSVERTRKDFLKAAGAAWIALAGTLGCEPDARARAAATSAQAGRAWAFRTRPDLRPPS